MTGSNGAWCISGDLNVVRGNEERLNLQVNNKEARDFNEFINNAKFIEIPMRGRKFTGVSDDEMKFSKLYRFLLNEEFCNICRNILVVALDRKLSDHCPIMLKDVVLDFEPRPFREFDMWLEEKDIDQVVGEVWRMEAMRWELEAENRDLGESERVAWMEARKAWLDKENEYRSMLQQKARLRWDVEGDGNSKFFHSYIKRRNNKNNIMSMMVNGLWCEDPSAIKAEMVRYYKHYSPNEIQFDHYSVVSRWKRF
ncbi:transposon TX1 [Tanacetum coccineum]